MAGLSLCLAVTLLVVWRAGEDEPYRAQTGLGQVRTVDAGAASETLAGLEAAIRSGDRNAAGALAATASSPVREQLAGMVDNARDAGMDRVSFRYVDETGAAAEDGSWPAAVSVTWRFRGFDRAESRTEVAVQFAPGDEGTGIAAIGGGGELRTPVWMTGALDVRRTAQVLVLSASSGAATDDYVAMSERAVSTVRPVLVGWRPRLVVEVPGDAAALERALDVEAGSYAQIAAVTGSSDGAVTAGTSFHVFVNPDVFEALDRRGREVVMAHEAVHVAGDGPLSQAPTWLIEGFADLVALRDAGVPLTEAAAQIREQVETQGLPRELPGPEQFDSRAPHLGAAYEAAWLVCRTLAQRAGIDRVRSLYERVSTGKDLEAELDAMFGWSQQDLTDAWRAVLRDLAASA